MSRTIRVTYTGSHLPEYEMIRRAMSQAQSVDVADSDRRAARVLRGLPVPAFLRIGLAPAPRTVASGPGAAALAKLPNAHLNG